MDIERLHSNVVPIHAVKPGQCFISNDTLYLKINSHTSYIVPGIQGMIALNFSDNVIVVFEPETKVLLVKGKIVIEH